MSDPEFHPLPRPFSPSQESSYEIEAVLFRQPETDPLTGLANRHALLERKAQWRKKPQQMPAALLYLDIDGFKAINTLYGHAVGDDFLRWIGKRLGSLTHREHFVAHLGNDEFAIFCEDTSLVKSQQLAQLAETRTVVDAEEIRFACDRILRTTTRASNILRGLRGFAREAAHDPMEFVSIHEIVEQSMELLQARVERNNVAVSLDIDPGVPAFLCRGVQIGQIVTNLLNNAFDAIAQCAPADRWIALLARQAANYIYIDVIDGGPGIEDHFKPHLMEPFFTTKELGLGMGVGLSLSRAIAQDHNGTLTLLEGTEHTTFRLALPFAPEGGPATQESFLEGTIR